MHVAIVLFACSAAISYLCGFVVYRQLLKWGIIDRPNERSSHSQPTARGGGIGIMLVVVFGAIVLIAVGGASRMLMVLVLFAILIAGISFIDDLKSLPARVRFGCHAVAGVAVLFGLGWGSIALELSPDLRMELPWILGMGLAFLWVAGYTNAFNFMDGINGIAAGQAVVTGIGSGVLVGIATGEWLSLPVLFAFLVSGAAAGFLPHNFPRARMFMGDVSSAPLGFLLAALTLWLAQAHGWWLLIPLALLHANFVLDTGITLFRRIWRGEKWHAMVVLVWLGFYTYAEIVFLRSQRELLRGSGREVAVQDR
jgi:UDP-N-acetylmuramyl pentapeptide phosphotransferase/UDP-N-acetylglucosamine-1-phosphate transferase